MNFRPQDDLPLPEELKTADLLLGKADALIRRHRGSEDPAFDDLPVLTDVVDPASVASISGPAAPASAVPTAPDPASDGVAARAARPAIQALLAERMVELDASINRSVEEWLADEMPQIISREFDAMIERARIEALAHMRATLMPEISGCISQVLDELPKDLDD